MPPAAGRGKGDRAGRRLHIVADENIPGLDETFARHGRITRRPGRTLDRAELKRTDVLIVRSVTRVDRTLLDGTAVRFVGTATIGTDHLDTGWLEHAGIDFASAPGCNADAAAQYTLAMMLLASKRMGMNLATQRIGIVGFGNVGSRVAKLVTSFGAPTPLVTDPPLAAGGQPGFCSLDAIAACRVVSLHVPLTSDGRWPTYHMIGGRFLSRLPERALLVNTARGAVIEPAALGTWLDAGRGFAAFDVWPGEPAVPARLIRQAVVATPHVAGYSTDGKLRGTLQIYRAFLDWLGEAPVTPDLPESLHPETLPATAAADAATAVLAACPVERDDGALRTLAESAPTTDTGPRFDALRRDYPPRRDFAGWRLPPAVPAATRVVLRNLGFR